MATLTLSTDNGIVAESLHGEQLAIQDGQHLGEEDRGGNIVYLRLCTIRCTSYSTYVHGGLKELCQYLYKLR